MCSSDLKAEVEQVLQEELSKEDVPKEYVLSFVRCGEIEPTSQAFPLDKLGLVYKYGSWRAKQITVDEKLKN